MNDTPHDAGASNGPDEPIKSNVLTGASDPNQTIDEPPPDSVGPEQTTDLPRAAHDTDRSQVTSVRPPVPTETYHPESFDPNRTGAHTPSEEEHTEAAAFAGRPSPAGYEILGELGRGGMGVVYKAREIGLNRVVALKMILAGPHASKAVLARFRAEAQAVARFQHPNLVQVFQIGEFEGMPFFTLEFVDGGTLSKKISRSPQVPKYAAQTVEQLARAMQYAHDRGIAHRDLKPANILIAPDGTPKITDFGLAKELEGDSGQTQSGQIMGTPSYMAPEQAEGRVDVGHPADVYALGAILYDLLTGRPPFTGSSVLDTLELVRTREPVPPSELTGKLPRDLETICLKCLQKAPQKRYESAGALADDLQRYLEGRPIVARPVGRVERAVRWARRDPIGALASALGLAFVATLVVLVPLLYVAKAEATEAKGVAETALVAKDKALVEETAAVAREKQAVIDKEKARAAEEVAKKKAIEQTQISTRAGTQFAVQRNESLLTIRDVVREIDTLMKSRGALAPLRLLILNKMLARLDAIKVPDELSVLDARTEAIAYSRLGGVYFETNRVDEALKWTEKSHSLFKRLVDETPQDPAAVFNLGAISNQLADVEWQLGNGTRSRELRVVALKARQAYVPLIEALREKQAREPLLEGLFHALVSRQGKIDAGNVTNSRFLLAEAFGLLAVTELRLGDPAAAIENYLASDRGFAALDIRGTLPVRRRRAEIQARLGDAKLHLGQLDEAEKHYRAGLMERETLLKLTPDSAGYGPGLRADITLSRIYLGDFLLAARKDSIAATQEYESAFKLSSEVLKSDPDLLPVQRLVAVVHYRLGYVARKRSGFAAVFGAVDANRHFGDALKMHEALAKIDPSNAPAKVELALALGRAGRATDAEKLAKQLLALKDVDLRVRFQAICGLAVAAGGATDPEVSKRCKDRAFQELAELVRGWKARGQLELDPDLETLRADPRFEELVKSAPRGDK